MWNRFTEGIADIVAPEEQTEHVSDRAAASSTPSPSTGSVPCAPVVDVANEQEQYIWDLERALLQRKKQNDALQAKIRQLESERLQEQVERAPSGAAALDKLPSSSQDRIACKERSVDTESMQDTEAKIEALMIQCQAQEKELTVLRTQVKALEARQEKLQKSEQDMCRRAAEYEQGYMKLLVEMEARETKDDEEHSSLVATHDEHYANSLDRQRLHDLEAQLRSSEADKAIAQQDAERLQHEVDTLEGVLCQFQVEKKAQMEYTAAVEAELAQVKSDLQTWQHVSTGRELERSELTRVMEELAIKTRECAQLREAVESTARQYHAEAEVMDKRVAAELVVTYIASEKKSEVLALMARMMGFTEDQKRRAGMGSFVEGNGGGGLFSSLVELLAPGEGNNESLMDPSTMNGKTFADVWSEFLLEEASKGN